MLLMQTFPLGLQLSVSLHLHCYEARVVSPSIYLCPEAFHSFCPLPWRYFLGSVRMQDTLAFHCRGKCETLKCVQQYCISRICIADHLHRDEACLSRYCLMKVLWWRGLSWYGAHADTDHGLVTLGVGYIKKTEKITQKGKSKSRDFPSH